MFYKLNAEESSHMVRASQAGVRLINKEGQKLGGAKGGCQKLLSEFCRGGDPLNGKSFFQKNLIGKGGTPPPLNGKSAKLFRNFFSLKELKIMFLY